MRLIGTIRLKPLGGFSASLALGRAVELVGKKNRPLLAYLALGRGQATWPREADGAAMERPRGGSKPAQPAPGPHSSMASGAAARGQRATPHRIVRTVANSLTATPYPFPMDRWPMEIALPGARTLASVVSIRPAIAAACGAPWLRRALPACS